MKKLRFSSHVQLQYLLKKFNIDQRAMVEEMRHHYEHTDQQLKTTKKNKVTAVVGADKELAPPPIRKKSPRKSERNQKNTRPKYEVVPPQQPAVKVVPVAYKRKRFTVTHE